MPRLLSLNTYHYRRGGSDVVFLEHDRLFRSLGWETAVMTMHHPNNDPSPWSPYFADEIEFGHDYSPWRKLRMAGKVIYSGEARKKIGRMLDDFPADVVHAHCIYHHLSPSVLAESHRRGIPTVMTAHDLKLACPAYKMLNRHGICERCKGGNLTHVVANRCVRDSLAVSAVVFVESAVHRVLGLYRRNLDRVITPSRFYRDKLVEWGWTPAQVSVIPNYVMAQQYQPRYEPGRHFLYFGRLAPEKGLRTLIEAVARTKLPLRVIGTGPLETELRELAARRGAPAEFLGFRAGDALWNEVRACRAVVLPSEWYENAPMSVLESYACGKPVIGARVGGIPELIQPDVTGFLFESGNADDLTDALAVAAHLPDAVLTDIGREARAHVVTSFTCERYIDDMLALYREIGVAAPPRSPAPAASDSIPPVSI